MRWRIIGSYKIHTYIYDDDCDDHNNTESYKSCDIKVLTHNVTRQTTSA